jgi:hypothetical protein
MKTLLKRWLGGEVNWEEEKELREHSKQDSFLSESMQGYDTFPEADHLARINHLKKRIKQKKKKENTNLFYLKRFAAAAALVGVIGLTFWLQRGLKNDNALVLDEATEKINNTALETPEESASTSSQLLSEGEETNPSEPVAIPEVKKAPIIAKNKSQKLKKSNSIKKNNSAPQPSPPVINSVAKSEDANAPLTTYSSEPIVENNSVEAIAIEEEAMPQQVEEVVAEPQPNTLGIEETESFEKVTQNKMIPTNPPKQRSRVNIINNKKVNKTIAGRIQDQFGKDVENATIQFINTPYSTLSNPNGQFQIQIDTPVNYVVISKNGYVSNKVSLNPQSRFLDIQLKEKQVGFAKNKDQLTMRKANMAPRPKGGFLKFERYVKKEMIYPIEANEQGIEKEVEVHFFIDNNGQAVDFQTTELDSYGFEKEAIRLIKEGPTWKPRNQKAYYIIKFEIDQ